MNTCDTCKWWGKVTWMRPRRGEHLACEHVLYERTLTDIKNTVTAIHDNDFGSELFTGPKFGCVHHEVK
jgi:hypothetical protein